LNWNDILCNIKPLQNYYSPSTDIDIDEVITANLKNIYGNLEDCEYFAILKINQFGKFI